MIAVEFWIENMSNDYNWPNIFFVTKILNTHNSKVEAMNETFKAFWYEYFLILSIC